MIINASSGADVVLATENQYFTDTQKAAVRKNINALENSTGSVVANNLAANAVTTNAIRDDSITRAKIQPSATILPIRNITDAEYTFNREKDLGYNLICSKTTTLILNNSVIYNEDESINKERTFQDGDELVIQNTSGDSINLIGKGYITWINHITSELEKDATIILPGYAQVTITKVKTNSAEGVWVVNSSAPLEEKELYIFNGKDTKLKYRTTQLSLEVLAAAKTRFCAKKDEDATGYAIGIPAEDNYANQSTWRIVPAIDLTNYNTLVFHMKSPGWNKSYKRVVGVTTNTTAAYTGTKTINEIGISKFSSSFVFNSAQSDYTDIYVDISACSGKMWIRGEGRGDAKTSTQGEFFIDKIYLTKEKLTNS